VPHQLGRDAALTLSLVMALGGEVMSIVELDAQLILDSFGGAVHSASFSRSLAAFLSFQIQYANKPIIANATKTIEAMA